MFGFVHDPVFVVKGIIVKTVSQLSCTPGRGRQHDSSAVRVVQRDTVSAGKFQIPKLVVVDRTTEMFQLGRLVEPSDTIVRATDRIKRLSRMVILGVGTWMGI